MCAEGELCSSCNAPVWVPGRRKCKHKVQLLCQVNIEHLHHALACAALVQSSAWEVASRKPDDVMCAVRVSALVSTSKPTKSTKGGASSGASGGRGRRSGSRRRPRSQGRSSHGQGNQQTKKHGPSAHGTQHNGAPPTNRLYFEKHVYAGIPRESDMVALKATQRFSSVKPLMVGIPVIGGPPVSTPSSSAVRGCGWCGLLSMPQLCSLVRGNADEACPGVLGHQPQQTT